MMRLLAPAVALMYRLRYPHKFLLISVLFSIPLGVLTYLWLHQIHDQLEFTRQERAGLAYGSALVRISERLQRSHALAILATAGDTAALAQLAEERTRIAAATRAVDQLDATLGRRLGVSDQWQELRPRLLHPSVHARALVMQTRQLMSHIGDKSNLVLDPDLDSYYLMDAVLTRLPAIADQLSAVGVGLIERSVSRQPAGTGELPAAVALAQAERAAVDRGHAVAFRENPTLRDVLET